MQFRIKTFWRGHHPGDIVEAAVDEIHALICSGYADPVKSAEQSAKEAQEKATEVKPDDESGDTSTAA